MGTRSVRRAIFTIGYEGRSPDDLFDVLDRNGIELVIDVRERASSRKPGFSREALGTVLEDRGIAYRHFQELGSPPDLRRKYEADRDRVYFERHYRRSLEDKGEMLEELANLAGAMPVALLCFERDPGHCHRSIVASELARAARPALQVRNL